MDVLNYERAVDICAGYFEDVLSSEKIEGRIAFNFDDHTRLVFIGPGLPLSANEVRKAPDVWVSTAQNNKMAHEALIAAVTAMRKDGENVPRQVEEWLIALALSEIHPPDGPKRKQSDLNEGLVYHAVAALIIKAGFYATSNSERGSNSNLAEKRCACDVVADALGRYRQKSGSQLPSSYDYVRKIWQRAKVRYPIDTDIYNSFAVGCPIDIWNSIDRAILNEE